MTVLHGSWFSQGYLFIWGEIWRRFTPTDNLTTLQPHPFALLPDELKTCWQQFPVGQSWRKFGSELAQISVADRAMIALPSKIIEKQEGRVIIAPLHSAQVREDLGADAEIALYPWLVDGLRLPPLAAMKFLSALPLGSTADREENCVGEDLRFWSHIARWSLDLLARAKVLPTLERQGQKAAIARWQPLLDSAIDQERFRQFVRQMPFACQSYQSHTELAVNLPQSAGDLLLSFLQNVLEAQVQRTMDMLPPPVLPTKFTAAETKTSAIQQWLQALKTSTVVQLPPALIQRLDAILSDWAAPLQAVLPRPNQYRACLYLQAPVFSGASVTPLEQQARPADWTVEYFLQAVDNPDFLIPAAAVWSNPMERLTYQNRTIEHPQETLLAGLGLASRLYPVLEPSLRAQRPQSCQLTPFQAYEFIKSIAWRLEDSGLGVVLPPSLANREGWANRLGLQIKADAIAKPSNQRLGLQSLLNFKWELSIGGQRLSRSEFDRLVALNTPLVEINGEWVELRPQDVRAAQTFFSSRKDQMALSLEDALRISLGDTQTIEKLPVVGFEASGPLQELVTTLTGNRTIETIAPPRSFRGKLRPYQAKGVGWLAFLEQWGLGACLADDMGLGKTPQTIAFLLHLQEQKGLEKPVLIVCPTSVLSNWEREVHRFGPTLKTLVYHGDKRPKGKAFNKAVQAKHLVITSYALVYRDAKELQSVKWQGIILDEAQNIKNPETKQSQTVRQLEADFRIALTGTPVENRLSELWSVLDFLNPGYLGARNFFQRRFATPIERYGDTASLQTLRSLVQPFILRRLKTDRDIIQDLPEKQEMPVFCGLSAEQASLYQHTVESSLQEIETADGIQRRGMILGLLVKLKQICNHPAQFLKEKSLGAEHRSGKLQRLQEMLEEVLAEGDRALIFTQFAEWGKLLQAYLENYLGRETLFLYGATSKKQREEMIDRFQHDPQGPRLFILSLKAGGVGLNLTRANHVFHFDRWWNPAVENQATDRVFRIGQTRNVLVHKFVCSGTLEEKIHDLIESKKALAEQVIGTGEDWLTELDTEALRNLLLLDRRAVIDEEE